MYKTPQKLYISIYTSHLLYYFRNKKSIFLSTFYFSVCTVPDFPPYINVTTRMAESRYALGYRIDKHQCCKALVSGKYCIYPKKSNSANTYDGTNRRYKGISVSLQASCHNIHYTLYKFKKHSKLHSCHCNLNYQCTDSENSKQLPSCKKCRQAQ